MAKLLGHEFEALDAKSRSGKSAGADEHAVQVRGSPCQDDDDGNTDGLQAIDQDLALVDVGVSTCIKKLQTLCWLVLLLVAAALGLLVLREWRACCLANAAARVMPGVEMLMPVSVTCVG